MIRRKPPRHLPKRTLVRSGPPTPGAHSSDQAARRTDRVPSDNERGRPLADRTQPAGPQLGQFSNSSGVSMTFTMFEPSAFITQMSWL